jgi:hypothetical protein
MRWLRAGACVLTICLFAGCNDGDRPGPASPGSGGQSPNEGFETVLAPLPDWTAVADPPAQASGLPDTRVFPYKLAFQSSPVFPRDSSRFVAVSWQIPGEGISSGC